MALLLNLFNALIYKYMSISSLLSNPSILSQLVPIIDKNLIKYIYNFSISGPIVPLNVNRGAGPVELYTFPFTPENKGNLTLLDIKMSVATNMANVIVNIFCKIESETSGMISSIYAANGGITLNSILSCNSDNIDGPQYVSIFAEIPDTSPVGSSISFSDINSMAGILYEFI